MAGGCGIFPSRGRDWPVDAVYSHRGAAIGRWMRYIPIEGSRLGAGCGIFPSRGRDWAVDA
eukprot:1187246-Prorocentrum_minimum.AAC.2